MDKFEIRICELMDMDKRIRELCEDEELFEVWLSYGVPDWTDEDDLLCNCADIAEDENSYREIRALYRKLMKKIRKNESLEGGALVVNTFKTTYIYM